ncbi:UDP-forming cellulose synthase catalytic subunit [Alteromonas sp. 1_MG-2023]|uniref:UDP-forming cellulose synthase catalytic subunit n=1 Tax=Alteromonas sp. 1_MG-2023 TaxID=3062669 RepID=UPI0026E3C0DB|nr:UDP-forming cellulose synthase catalytic subunit [Alteromonas sp. 1_MG-2023]MDO6477055.1 UDP-forming cellulose synthase catalytic subunit [Alteromonas sp. 1_MG-2023]
MFSNSVSGPRSGGLVIVFIAGLSLLGLLLLVPMDAWSQLLVSAVLLIAVHLCSQESRAYHRYQQFFRMVAIFLGLALTVRYLIWRGLYTLTATDVLSLVAVWLLYLAEIYAGITHVMGCIVNSLPLSRPLKTIRNIPEEKLPTVDVLIPTYNEPAELLEVTLRAALMLKYPQEKLAVHLLDDGSTEQKITQQDVTAANRAGARKAELSAMCERLGVHYHARKLNHHAKAGNINDALLETNGELIVVLDADHVPTMDFLDHTVPWLVENEKVFLVQTPHFMANPDPVERNYFSAFSRMPSENDMFYGTIQRGLDFWSASFFCGSAAVLRRSHLEMVGGLSGESITEDAETAFDLHAMGYESVYVDRPMVSGLAPETFDAFVTQRMRWAQGMTQILLLKKPFMEKKLSWHQRMGYMSSILFWLFPFARIIFLLMPLAYLVFGMQVYHASMTEIMAYTMPHVIATYMLSTMLFGKTRWPLVSELYEILQCIFTLRALTKVFRNPRAPSFVVTPKGENLTQTFISPLSGVFYALLLLVGIAMVAGVVKMVNEPLTRELTAVVLGWNAFNLLLLVSVMGVLVERKQVREQARLPANDYISLIGSDGNAWTGHLIDLSLGGAKLRLSGDTAGLPEKVTLITDREGDLGKIRLPCQVLSVSPDNKFVRFQFVQDEGNIDQIVRFVLGDSRRWQSFQRRRTRPVSYWFGVKHVLRVSVRPAFQHLYLNSRRYWQKMRTAKGST